MASINASITSTGIVANGDATGVLQLQSNGTTALTINADASVTVNTDLSVSGSLVKPLVSKTAQASTSGTAIIFTDIPSWATRITVMLSGVSTSGTSDVIIQLGTSSGYVTSGYLGSAITLVGSASPGSTAYSSGFLIRLGGAAVATAVRHGKITVSTLGSNVWIGDVIVSLSDAVYSAVGSGSLTLPGTLDRIRVTTVNGTDTFDAGSINILYE